MIPSYILYRYFASIKIPTWMQLNLLKLIFLINSSNTLITFKSKDKRVRELNIAESEGDSHGPAGWCCHVNKRSMSHYSIKKVASHLVNISKHSIFIKILLILFLHASFFYSLVFYYYF